MRRLQWKLYWQLGPRKPLVLDDWWEGMSIILPRSGCAAPIFYRRFSSEPLVRVLAQTLRPGMTVLDVGAHIGEYTLIAAQLVGKTGTVIAFEPEALWMRTLSANIAMNGLKNVHIEQVMVGDRDRGAAAGSDSRSMADLLVDASSPSQPRPPRISLDGFAALHGLADIGLIKIDAAGNERDVVLGSRQLLERRAVRSIICKFYHPQVVSSRFGYHPRETLELLNQFGFTLSVLRNEEPAPITASTDTTSILQGELYGLSILGVAGE